MKITQLRGDLAAFRNLELSLALNGMKTENSRKPVSVLRQNIPYLTPQTKSLAAEKVLVVLFGVTLKRDSERIGVASYTGLVLLSFGNLIDRAEAAAIRDRAAGFPQTLASFIATSNTFSLLTDTTGSRRFIGVEVKGMIRIEPVDYPQLYAQAVNALREGERYWFSAEEEVRLHRNNRAFEKRPLLEELFLYYFRAPEEEEECTPLSAPEILMSISKQSKTDLTETKLELFVCIYPVQNRHWTDTA